MWHDGWAERELADQYGESSSMASEHKPPNTDIQSLIVTLKAGITKKALSTLSPRLSPSSVVTLIQNGMGVYDELCREIWPDPRNRPFFVIGTTTHGATMDEGGGGRIRHRSKPGQGELKFGVVPDPRKQIDFEQWLWGGHVGSLPLLAPPPSPSLPLPPAPGSETDLTHLKDTLSALLSLSHLTPSLLPMPHLNHEQMLKVALNSIINPLTAILGSGALPNGSLFGSYPAHHLIRSLAKETSAVIIAYLEIISAPRGDTPPPDVLRIFSPESLEKRVVALVRSTSDNISSMAQDVSRGRPTEINYINGYISNLGERVGVNTPCHDMIIEMVKHTALINGLSRDLNPQLLEQVEKVENKKRRLSVINDFPRKLSPVQQAMEEKRLDLEQRKIWLEEERVVQERRERRQVEREERDVKAGQIFAENTAAGLEVPTVEQWQAFTRRAKKALLARAQESNQALKPPDDGQANSRKVENSNPPEPESPAPVAQSTAPTFSPTTSYASIGSSLDSMISSAPRQERTWDVPLAPPTARGLLPKRQPQAVHAKVVQDGPSSSPEPVLDFGASLTTPATRSEPSLDSLISSAPRGERKWGPSESTITSHGLGSRSSLEGSIGSVAKSTVSSLGNALDALIAGAPRQERTWEVVKRGEKKGDVGRFATSRLSGS